MIQNSNKYCRRFRVAFTAGAALMMAAPVTAQILHLGSKPATVNIQVSNNTGSASALTIGSIQVKSNSLIAAPVINSVLPITVDIGATQNISLFVSASAGATDGVSGNFVVQVVATNLNAYPIEKDTTVDFPIGPWPFFDGSAVVFVRQNAVRGGLKFGELLRRREVGRLPSKFESYSAGSYGFERFASLRGAFAGCEARKVMSLLDFPLLYPAGTA